MRGTNLLSDWDVGRFQTIAANADGFNVLKRTNSQGRIHAGTGKRASGWAFVGDVSGGLE